MEKWKKDGEVEQTQSSIIVHVFQWKDIFNPPSLGKVEKGLITDQSVYIQMKVEKWKRDGGIEDQSACIRVKGYFQSALPWKVEKGWLGM